MAEPAPQIDGAIAVLASALAVAGFSPGERFELMRVVRYPGAERGVAQGWIGVDRAEAAAWVDPQPRDVYLCLNPLREDARPPKGVARGEDVALVRRLYVDADPTVQEGREDAQALARDVAQWARARWGVSPTVLDTGRGAGVLLAHEPVETAVSGEVRKLVAEGLALRFKRPKARLDSSPCMAQSHARLVGSRNGKTGNLVQVVEEGDGRAVAWRDLVAFAAEVRAEAPPPKLGAWKVPQELRAAIGDMPARSDAWSWLGAAAGRAGVHDRVAELVPDDRRPEYDRGAGNPGRKWAKPEVPGLVARVEKGLERVASSATRASRSARAIEAVTITGITRRSEGAGRGGLVDLEIEVEGVRFRVRGLDGRTLRSYGLFAARASVEGAWLPQLGKDGNDVWHSIVEKAWTAAKVVEEREGGTHAAVVDAVRTHLRNRGFGKTAADLGQGRIVTLEDGRLAVPGPPVVRAVRDLLQGDLISREAIADAARELGADLGAEIPVPDAQGRMVRRRVWTFPSASREES